MSINCWQEVTPENYELQKQNSTFCNALFLLISVIVCLHEILREMGVS